MVSYLADTNVFVRFFIHDNPKQGEFFEKVLLECKKGKAKVTILSEVIPEIEYVLRKVYRIDRKKISENLLNLINTRYLGVEKRDVWRRAIQTYSKNNIDIVDAILFAESQSRRNEILSFDKDFKRIRL